MGGACNITTRNKSTGVVSFDWASSEKLTSHLWAYAELGLKWISVIHPAAIVVLCPLTGSYLPTLAPDYGHHQQQIDTSIREFNNHVIGINRRADVAMPWCHRHVHKTRHGKDKDYYQHLPKVNPDQPDRPSLPDGIHPSQDLLISGLETL